MRAWVRLANSEDLIAHLERFVDPGWTTRVVGRLTPSERMALRWHRHLQADELLGLDEISASKVEKVGGGFAAVFSYEFNGVKSVKGRLLSVAPMALIRETWKHIEDTIGQPWDTHAGAERNVFVDASGQRLSWDRLMISLAAGVRNA